MPVKPAEAMLQDHEARALEGPCAGTPTNPAVYCGRREGYNQAGAPFRRDPTASAQQPRRASLSLACGPTPESPSPHLTSCSRNVSTPPGTEPIGCRLMPRSNNACGGTGPMPRHAPAALCPIASRPRSAAGELPSLSAHESGSARDPCTSAFRSIDRPGLPRRLILACAR
jgi:hypothetical protein